jgi:tetratricopeptide (TPR) repeat protein
MKKNDPNRYVNNNYRSLEAKVFNALGENLNLTSPGDLEAYKSFNKAIELDNDFALPYYNLGNFALENESNYPAALNYYQAAEKRGFTNDRQDFNLGWLHYRNKDYYDSYSKTKKLQNKYPDNNNLKFMLGTILYKLDNFDLAESELLESYQYYIDLKQKFYPLEMEVKKDKKVAEMLFKTGNNLGAALQKKYETTQNTKYLVWATKYYSDSIEFYDKYNETAFNPTTVEEYEKEKTATIYEEYTRINPHHNLRMVLYPYSGQVDPFLFEEFPLNYEDDIIE